MIRPSVDDATKAISPETKAIAMAFGVALVAAIGTSLGAWAVELGRRALKVEPPKEE